VKAVAFAIGFFPATMPGLYAAPAPYAPDLHATAPAQVPIMAGLAVRLMPVKRIEILKRRDAFPRELTAHGPP
jgi:hypothetical protein